MEIFESIDVSKLSTNDEFYVKLRTGTEIEFGGNLDDLVPELSLRSARTSTAKTII
ncbi:MAG: hypothetical protein ACLUSP_00045 [Christensenellales bacterium]